MTTFLSPEDVAELTGVRTGRNGMTREALQAETLSTMGVPHFINRIGRPIVARAVIEGGANKGQNPAPSWSPRISHA